MADCATFNDARDAVAAGADVIGSTMSGYTGELPMPTLPDIALVQMLVRLGVPVLAEGRYNTPELAADAIRAGAAAVVVGSAITRPEHATAWFRAAIEKAARPTEVTLVYDIGGTKTLAALVRGSDVLETRTVRTDPNVGGSGWLDRLAGSTADWTGCYVAAAVAATGLIENGRWSALNSGVLSIPNQYPLRDDLSNRLGVSVTTINDAQAAAWGEYRHGAGQNRNIVYVTVSSGVGGGIVMDGRLIRGARGLAGSLGQIPWGGNYADTLEARASGFAMASAANVAGQNVDARSLFAAAANGALWADRIIAEAAVGLAAALASVQALIDPDRIVMGGGVGLAPGFLERVRRAFTGLPCALMPDLVPARLGINAGIIGAADLARQSPE